MANHRDFARYFDPMTAEGRRNCAEIEIGRCGWPIEVVAGVVYIDAAIWHNYEATDVVYLSHEMMAMLLVSPFVSIVDNGLRDLHQHAREAYDVLRLRERLNRRMEAKHFAVQFSGNPYVPSNLRGEMIDVRQVDAIFSNTADDFIATSRRSETFDLITQESVSRTYRVA